MERYRSDESLCYPSTQSKRKQNGTFSPPGEWTWHPPCCRYGLAILSPFSIFPKPIILSNLEQTENELFTNFNRKMTNWIRHIHTFIYLCGHRHLLSVCAPSFGIFVLCGRRTAQTRHDASPKSTGPWTQI